MAIHRPWAFSAIRTFSTHPIGNCALASHCAHGSKKGIWALHLENSPQTNWSQQSSDNAQRTTAPWHSNSQEAVGGTLTVGNKKHMQKYRKRRGLSLSRDNPWSQRDRNEGRHNTRATEEKRKRRGERWKTIDKIPTVVRRKWSTAFVDCQRYFNAAPSLEAFIVVFWQPKLL